MDSVSPEGTTFDPVTGVVKEETAEPAEGKRRHVVPSQVTTGQEMAKLPDTFAELAEYFQEPEPSPQEVFKAIMGVEEMADRDPEESARSILARILMAETPEEMLNGHKVVHGQEILNVPIVVKSVKWQKSTLDGASAVYAVMKVDIIGTDQQHTVTVGGRNVMTALLNAQVRNFFPLRCMIERSQKPTEAGYYPLWLVPA